MKKGLLIALVIALALIIIGAAIAYVGYSEGGEQMFEPEKKTNEYRVEEGFDSVFIDGTSCGVTVRSSGSESCVVTADENEKLYFTVEVRSGRLEIVQHDEQRWIDKLFAFKNLGYKLTVDLPERYFESVKIKNVSGSVRIESRIACKELNVESVSGSVALSAECRALGIQSTSGSVSVENTECETANIVSTSGRVSLDHVTASQNLSVEVTSGSIRFTAIDGGELHMEAVSGSIRGTVLTGKRFRASAVSGSVHVPEDGEGGLFEAHTTSGSIDITIAE